MKISYAPCGEYQTNCYIVEKNGKSLIIDPGVGAASFVKEVAVNPVAILNTHGHFDHVWSNQEVKEYFDIPIYIREEDGFWLHEEDFRKIKTPVTIHDIARKCSKFEYNGISKQTEQRIIKSLVG